jgi:acetylornithine deacetylase/succinyl-diaminopimelate desuccinylase-like protein
MSGKELNEIYRYLEKHFDESLEELKDFLRLGTVAAENLNVREGAEKVAKIYEKLGAETEIIELKGGNPVVYGKILSHDPKAKTVIHYNKYDGNPTDEPDWIVPPYATTVMDSKDVPDLPPHLGKVIVNRAACDSKGPHFGAIKGLEAMLETTGDIPVNLHLICEGEHEEGSPNLGQLNEMSQTKDVLKNADCFMQMAASRGGSEKLGMDMKKAQVRLGCKGGLFINLRVRGGDWGGPVTRDLEGEGAWIDSPVWRLVWALSSLKEASGKTLIDGFYDDLRPLTPEEKRLGLELRDQIFEEEQWKKLYGIKQFRRGLSGRDLFLDWIFAPEIEIVGLGSGYQGTGTKSGFSKEAWAKILIRPQPNQDTKDLAWKLRKHLNAHGFPEVEIDVKASYSPLRTSADSYLAKSMINATKRIGLEPVIFPSLWAGAPYSQIAHVPYGGINGMTGGHYHQANEYIVISTIIDGMKLMSTWCYEFAGRLNAFKE